MNIIDQIKAEIALAEGRYQEYLSLGKIAAARIWCEKLSDLRESLEMAQANL
jgi:hypothetical protein